MKSHLIRLGRAADRVMTGASGYLFVAYVNIAALLLDSLAWATNPDKASTFWTVASACVAAYGALGAIRYEIRKADRR